MAHRRFAAFTLVLAFTFIATPRQAPAQGGGCAAPPLPIAVGQDLRGTLASTDCIDTATGFPYDRYTFDAIAGHQYTVAFNAKPIRPTLKIYDANGALVATGVQEGFYRCYATFEAGESGPLTIVGSGTGPGTVVPSNYQVWVRDDELPCVDATTPIEPSQTLSGRLNATDCYGDGMDDSFADRYTFTGQAGGEYTIVMRSEDVDAFMALKDPSGAVVTTSNNGAGGLDAMIVWRPTVTGTYTIEASSYDPVSRSQDGLGVYTLSLADYFCGSQTAAIAPGQTLGGTLSTTDCPSPHRPPWFDHYHDTFTFAATAGTTYEIRMEAEDYDPYLYLLDAAGTILAENNDGGGGWNARIIYTPQASGVLTIEATSYYYHQTGPYTVSLATSAPCSSANDPIAPGQTVEGALATTDCYSNVNPDAFYDRYTMAVTAGTEYTIAVSSPGFYAYVEVRDPAGRVVFREGDTYLQNDIVFYMSPRFTGTYTLDVSSAHDSETGPYTVTLLANGNETCTQSSTPIAPEQTIAGTLAITDCYGTLRDHAYNDRYTFTGAAGAEYTIDMRSASLDTYLGIYGPDGALVAEDDDGGEDLLSARLEVTLPVDGEYTIEATSYWSTTTGAYEVEMTPGIERCLPSVVHVEPGQAVDAALDFTDCYGAYYPGSFADRYTFDVVPDTTYIIRMSCPTYSLDPQVALFNSAGSLLLTDDNSGPGLDARILFHSGVSDTMHVEAAATYLGSQTGPYTFSVTVYDGEQDCVPPATPIAPEQALEGELTEDDCYSPNRPFTYHDRYSFDAAPGNTYTIDLTSDEVDVWLILLDPDGNVLEQDDDGGFLGARIVFTPEEAGTYTVEATSYLQELTGSYEIRLAAEPAEEERGGCDPAPLKIDPGQTIVNSLTALDCFAVERPTSLHDRYALRTVAGARYVVTMASSEVDAYLVVVDPSGTVAAENNDDAGKLDARIDFVAATDGVYEIAATTNRPNAVGRYEVAVAGRAPDTVGVYLASTGAWFLRDTNTPGPADVVYTYGPSGGALVPLAGDWNGDGSVTAGLYDPSTGAFFLRDAHGPGGADAIFTFGPGGAGLVPIAGDWDGDGADTVGLYAPSTGAFFLRNQNAPGGADLVFTFGPAAAGFTPLSGDWNGDGTDTIGLYAPTTGAFFLRNANAGGGADAVFTFGAAGAGFVPLAGDWNADGSDTVGLYAASTGTFFLRNANAGGPADAVVGYGPPNATPVTGSWRGR
jgi:hypothetical protein